jgi:hypothetical protein
MPAPWGVGAAAGAIGMGLDVFSASSANKANRAIQQQQQAFQAQMSNTAYRRAVKDMQAAGLNPGLMFNSGGAASSPAGSTATMNPVTNSTGSKAMNLMSQQLLRHQIDKTEAEADAARASGISAAAQAQWDSYRMSQLLARNPGDGSSFGDSIIRSEVEQAVANARQAEQIADITGLGSGLANSFSGPLGRAASMSARGLSGLMSGAEVLERSAPGIVRRLGAKALSLYTAPARAAWGLLRRK